MSVWFDIIGTQKLKSAIIDLSRFNFNAQLKKESLRRYCISNNKEPNQT